jgi:predicted outer membrane repeat protein
MRGKALKAAAVRATAGGSAMLAVMAAGAGVAGAAVRNVTDVPCGAAALAAAIGSASGGGTLNLAAGCGYLLTVPLPAVGQDITIAGNGATLTRGMVPNVAAFSLLTAAPGVSLTVSNLNFSNGGSGAGGAITAGTAGGAIDSQGGALTVTGGVFTGNTASVGGAIENSGGGTLTVTGASFSGNSAAYGGAVDNEGTAALDDDSFTANTGTEWGGAVITSDVLTIHNCFFARNVAYLGGALFGTATATVKDSYLRYNRAGYNGGAVFADGSLTLTGSHIGYNTALSGGGVFNDMFAGSQFNDSVLRGNQAGFGGGLYNEDVVGLSGTRLHGNSAGRLGGGIYNGDDFGPPGMVALTATTVRGNHPDDCENCAAAAAWRAPRPARSKPLARSRPLALPGTAAPAGIGKLALAVTGGRDTLRVSGPGR